MKIPYLFLHLLNNDILRFYGLRNTADDRVFDTLKEMCRLGVLAAENGVVIPATSLFEVPETERLLSQTKTLQKAALLHQYGPTSELQDYAEKKLREYRDQVDLFGRYDVAMVTAVVRHAANVPWLPRVTRSASKDIGSAWDRSARDGDIAEILQDTRVATRTLTAAEAQLIFDVPKRLEGRAFVLKNVRQLLPVELHPRDVTKIAMLNNAAYVASYTDEYDGAIFTDTRIGDLSCGVKGTRENGSARAASLRSYRGLLALLGLDRPVLQFCTFEDLSHLKIGVAWRWLNERLLKDAVTGSRIVESAVEATGFRAAEEEAWHALQNKGQVLHEHVLRAVDRLRPHIEAEGYDLVAESAASAVPRRTTRRRTRKKSIDQGGSSMDKSKTVFLVHGRDDIAANWMRNFIRALGLDPLEWSKALALTGSTAPFILDIVRKGMDASQATVVLFTPDEEVRLRSECVAGGDAQAGLQSRPNVWFEAGMAMALMREKTILVSLGPNRPATDLDGINFVRLTDSSHAAELMGLAQKLQTAGCAVNLSGQDYVRMTPAFTPVR